MFLQSKVVILEIISQPNTVHGDLPAASLVTLDDLAGKEKYQPLTPPAHIPENFGAAAKTSLTLSVQMMCTLTAQERSLREWTAIIIAAGLEITEVFLRSGV